MRAGYASVPPKALFAVSRGIADNVYGRRAAAANHNCRYVRAPRSHDFVCSPAGTARMASGHSSVTEVKQ